MKVQPSHLRAALLATAGLALAAPRLRAAPGFHLVEHMIDGGFLPESFRQLMADTDTPDAADITSSHGSLAPGSSDWKHLVRHRGM